MNRVRERTDLDWAEFLDDLNTAFEDAYDRLLHDAARRDAISRVTLRTIAWVRGGPIMVVLDAERDEENGR